MKQQKQQHCHKIISFSLIIYIYIVILTELHMETGSQFDRNFLLQFSQLVYYNYIVHHLAISVICIIIYYDPQSQIYFIYSLKINMYL